MQKVKMVLCNNNSLKLKDHHMLKCLEKKKNSFDVCIVPLTKPIDRIDQSDKDNIDIAYNENISTVATANTCGYTLNMPYIENIESISNNEFCVLIHKVLLRTLLIGLLQESKFQMS